MKKINLTLFLFTALLLTPAIKLLPQDRLSEYLRIGLENNIVLKQKNISLQKAIYSLKSAASLYYPSLSLQAGYTHGSGGRAIAIPVGDMLNPVYQTLNMLTRSNQFPQISNVKEDLLPKKFYDVKIRASMPLLNTDIYYNHSIQAEQKELKDYEAAAYKKELIKEIKTAYFNLMCAREAVKIYSNARLMVLESKRINESLLKNGAGLPIYIIRAESELAAVETQIAEAEQQADMAAQAFNCLINRDIRDSVISDQSISALALLEKQNDLAAADINRREESLMLDKAVSINTSLVTMNSLYWVPKINMFMDIGVQDQVWKSRADSKYSLFGIQLDMPLFEGFRSLNKVSESELELKNMQLERDQLKKKLQLSSNDARGKLNTAVSSYKTAQKQLETASAYYRLVTRGYQEGRTTFIETLEGRVQFTNAELNVNLYKYRFLIAQAAWERESALNNEFDKE